MSDLNLLYPTPANDYVSSVQVPFSLFVLGVPLLLSILLSSPTRVKPNN